MIKLLQMPILKTIRKIMLIGDDSIWNMDLPMGINVDNYDSLFIGAEEKKEKIPTMVQLRVHTLKGGEVNEKNK